MSIRCVVTGAAGFIGSHLVERLLAEGHTVVGIDNLSVGRLSNLAGAARNDRFSFHHADIADYDTIRPLFAGAEWVFHLAALADIVPSIQAPMGYHRANVDGTIAVLESARLAGVKRFVYAASSSCYGLAETFPTPEDAPIQPMYPYALTKWMGEQYVMHWHKVYGLPAVALRMFNVFGPRARTSGTYGAVFGVFLAQKLAGKPLTLVGDGSQTRDFTYVTDVADAFYTAAGSSVTGEVMNVGSGGTHSVLSLVEMLGSDYIHIPKRPGEPDCTYADTGKINRLLGWAPKVGFADGVAKVLEHIEDWRDAPVWTPDAIAGATEDWFKYLGK